MGTLLFLTKGETNKHEQASPVQTCKRRATIVVKA